MLSNVGLNLSDSGLNFLYAFFVFWVLLILIGVLLQFYELGFRSGNFTKRLQELFKQYIQRLEKNSDHHKIES